MIRDYLRLSYDSLIHRGVRSWLTIIGIFIGITAVISLISLGEGLRGVVASQFNFLSTDVLVIQASGLNYGPPGSGSVNPLREKYVDDIERINGVDTSVGRIIEMSLLEFNGKSEPAFIASMPEGTKRKTIETVAQIEIARGRELKDDDSNKVVLGSNYIDADKFGKVIEIGSNVVINGKEFEVIGILKKKGSFTVDNAAIMNEDELKKVFNVSDRYNVIAAKISEGADMSAVKEKIEDYLRKERNVKKGAEDFSVQTPQQAIKTLDSVMFAIQIFIYVIAGISIIIGGIGISNAMYTAVTERTKEIGIMKSIGARNSDIFNLFLIESGLLGMVGGILGILCGLGLAYGLAFVGMSVLNTDLIRVNASMSLILGALAFSFLIGSVSGLLPAIQAAKLKPVDALRYAK
jgi:putative ABC transport system permease protein